MAKTKSKKKSSRKNAPPKVDLDLSYIIEPLRGLAIPIDDITPDPENARLHPDKNVDAIVESIRAGGFDTVVTVRKDDMVLSKGHGRLMALRKMGYTHVPAAVVEESRVEAVQRALADNRASDLSEDDPLALAKLLNFVTSNDGIAIGWDQTELEDMLKNLPEFTLPAETPPDPPPPDVEPPKPPKDPITRAGDVWTLGRHRIICGDCRDPDVVEELMGGAVINVAFTSPPYASQRKYDESSGFEPIKPEDYVEWFSAVADGVKAALANDGSWFVNIKAHCDKGTRHLYVMDLAIAHVREWEWRLVDEFSWERPSLPGKYPNRFKNGWEPIYHFSTGKDIKFRPENVLHAADLDGAATTDEVVAAGRTTGFTPEGSNGGPGFVRSKNFEGALPSNVVKVSGVDRGIEHIAMFPTGLPQFFIKAFSDPGDAIYDPFMGSGTTLISCEREGRTAYGCELSPGYCDVIVKRWEDETGEKATRN